MPIVLKVTNHGRGGRDVSRTDIDGEVRAARIAVLYRQAPIVVAVTLLNAGLVAFVLVQRGEPSLWYAWYGLVVLAASGGGVLWLAHRRRVIAGASAARWARLATLGTTLVGLLWGVGGAVLFPGGIVEQTFLAFVIGGMCAGALATLGYHWPAALGFVLPATLPIALRYFVDGTPLYIAMGSMILVFALALSLAALTFGRSLAEGLRLRFELADSAAALSKVNARLQTEMAEHRATEERLRQAQKMEAIGQLTGGVAHDFNNLLTAVIGHLDLAQRHVGKNAALTKALQGALAAADRGATLTQRLLAFARRQHLNPKTINVAALMLDVDTLLKQTLGPSIRLGIDVAPELWPARVDRHQLELAILNLAINARDAMPAGGTLRIGMRNGQADVERGSELMAGDYVVVSVADTGTGMDKATLARVFEPFFTTKGVGRGSGLGLPMVQGFAAQSGGAVFITSTPAQGTTVELWLPRADTTAGKSHAALEPAAPPGTASARILVCDDDADVRDFVATFLREAGHAVWEASSAVAALHILDYERTIDLLVADFAMPEMNGTALVASALQRQPGLKILLMTGHAEALSGGGVPGIPMLAKPFKSGELARRIADALPPRAA
jgi:signal transduction histidine kinase/CheY-like chemotaxis protein